MKQYRIVLDTPEVVETFAEQIKAYINQNPGYVPLLQAVEPSGDIAYIQYGLSFAQEFFQDLTIFGMTSHCALTPDTHSAKFPVVSLLLFEKSNYLVQGYDCDKRNLFTLVDSALYKAKETGRNKVVFRATNSV
jgi:hypothetical protein